MPPSESPRNGSPSPGPTAAEFVANRSRDRLELLQRLRALGVPLREAIAAMASPPRADAAPEKAPEGKAASPSQKVIEFPPGFVGPTIQRKEVVRRFKGANLIPGLKGGEDLKGRLRTVKDNDPLWVLRPGGAGRSGRGYYLTAVEWVERAYREIPDLARILSENAVGAVRRMVEAESKKVPPAALAEFYGPPRRKR